MDASPCPIPFARIAIACGAVDPAFCRLALQKELDVRAHVEERRDPAALFRQYMHTTVMIVERNARRRPIAGEAHGS